MTIQTYIGGEVTFSTESGQYTAKNFCERDYRTLVTFVRMGQIGQAWKLINRHDVIKESTSRTHNTTTSGPASAGRGVDHTKERRYGMSYTKEQIMSMTVSELSKATCDLFSDESCLYCESCESCKSCADCVDCLLCRGLNDAQHCVLNVHLTESEYAAVLKKMKGGRE